LIVDAQNVKNTSSARKKGYDAGKKVSGKRCAGNLEQVRGVLVDGGYSGAPFANAVQEKPGAKVQVAKRNELHTFVVIPQRWIVERSFGWLEQSRRLWKNPERLLNTSLQFMHLAFLSLLLKRL
jgi:transposase